MKCKEIFLTIELLLCFTWLAYMLVISIMMGFIGLGVAITEGDFGGLFFLGISLLGIAGLYGIFQVHLKLHKPVRIIEKPWVVLVCLASGVLGILISYSILQPKDSFGVLVHLLPVLSVMHYIYMLKGYLFEKYS